jgi:hypothetical protein
MGRLRNLDDEECSSLISYCHYFIVCQARVSEKLIGRFEAKGMLLTLEVGKRHMLQTLCSLDTGRLGRA